MFVQNAQTRNQGAFEFNNTQTIKQEKNAQSEIRFILTLSNKLNFVAN